MSKTKFLGIPEGGKRAGWIEMEGGGSAGGGGAGVFDFTITSNGDGGYVMDKTTEEFAKAFTSGQIMRGKLHNGNGDVFLYPMYTTGSIMFFGFDSVSGTPILLFVQIKSAEDIMVIENGLMTE